MSGKVFFSASALHRFMIRLSQGHLNLLETCPPRFQRIFLNQLTTLPDLGQLEGQLWGSQFHRLLQQHELGLPISALLAEDRQLQHSFTALLAAAPEIGRRQGTIDREAEHSRVLAVGNYLLTVIYDLIIFEVDRATIFDWKTYLKPEKPDKLANNWQTRLYLYVLAETAGYAPEQISMTYWFVRLPRAPESLTFTYDERRHDRTRRDLNRLLADLDRWLEDYRDHGTPFPYCRDCETACGLIGGRSAESLPEESIEEMGEINPFA